ncbi:MAG: DUF523 domain-containing protein [Candidatus Eremiobacterota bacterium]
MIDRIELLKNTIRTNSKILVSACLAGENCRYDGKNCLNKDIKKLVDAGKAIPLCPEVLGGLPVPRIPAEIIVCDGNKKIINRHGEDVTEFFKRGARKTLAIAKENEVICAILKSGSPSCGNGEIYDGTFSGKLTKGNGVTAIKLKEAGITVISDKEWLSMDK